MRTNMTDRRFQLLLLAVCLAATPVLGTADDDRVIVTSVIPTFAPPPQHSTLLIRGSGFSPRPKKATAPAVYLGGPGGQFNPLEIIEATDHAIRARLGAVTPGTWQLVVSLEKNFDGTRLP